MKRAEDFRKAFGPADIGFENAVRQTIQELTAQEERQEARGRRRILVPAIAAALVLTLGIGIAMAITALNNPDRWGVRDWLTENRPQGLEQTVPPVPEITAEPFAAQIDSEYATITVREALNDGYGMYLAVAFTPKEEDVFVFSSGINPFLDSPERIGIEPDEKGQTIARWAVSHGYRQLVRVNIVSMPDIPRGNISDEEMIAYLEEHGIPYRKSAYGGIVFDQVTNGAGLDAYLNHRMIHEEDGTAVVMVAGSSVEGQDEYPVTWTAVPCRMNANGTGNSQELQIEMEKWTQGTIQLHLPANVPGDVTVLARYAGTVASVSHEGETVPVTVKMIRTGLNDYYQIECADPGRSFQSTLLYPEGGNTDQFSDSFARSDIYSWSVRKKGETLVFTSSCRLPEELPDRLVIRWMETELYSPNEWTVIERTE